MIVLSEFGTSSIEVRFSILRVTKPILCNMVACVGHENNLLEKPNLKCGNIKGSKVVVLIENLMARKSKFKNYLFCYLIKRIPPLYYLECVCSSTINGAKQLTSLAVHGDNK